MEKKLLAAAIQDRGAYQKISRITELDEFSDLGAEIWTRIGAYYETDENAKSIDPALLKSSIERDLPKQAYLLNNEIDGFSETSIPNLLQQIIEVKRKAVAGQLATALLRNPASDEVKSFINQLNEIEEVVRGDDKIEPVGNYAHGILEEISNPSNLIQIYPKELNERIDGGCFYGNHIIVYARPNAGKSQFCINLSRGLCRDGHRVLYLANEEPKKQIISRVISRMSGKPKREMYQDIDAAIATAKENGLDNFYIEDINPGTFHQIRSLIEEVKPEIVIIDQLRNIKIKSEGRVNQLEQAATEARNLGKKYGILVVSVTQAGDSARNKLVLDDGDVDFSNTGIPAQADLMIGIGVNDDFRQQGMRMISIAKNKLSSDHTHFSVRVDEATSKMVSI